MSKKYPGLYLYFDWMRGLSQLPPEVAMKIIVNLYHFAEEGIEPEPLEDLSHNILQNMYMDQMRRSKKQSESGRIGGKTRVRNAAQNPGQTPSAVPSTVSYPDFTPDDEEYDDPEISEVFERFGVPFKRNPAPNTVQ